MNHEAGEAQLQIQRGILRWLLPSSYEHEIAEAVHRVEAPWTPFKLSHDVVCTLSGRIWFVPSRGKETSFALLQ